MLKLYSDRLYICFPSISVSFSSAVSPLVWNWLFRENWWGHLETWAPRVSVWFLMHVLIDANYMVYFIIYCLCLLSEEKILIENELFFKGFGFGCPFHGAFSVQGLVVESAAWKMLLQVKFRFFVKGWSSNIFWSLKPSNLFWGMDFLMKKWARCLWLPWESICLAITWWLPASGKESACQYRRLKRHVFDPWVGKMPWSRRWQLMPVFLPGESHRQRSLVCCSPWGHRGLGMTAWLTAHTHDGTKNWHA